MSVHRVIWRSPRRWHRADRAIIGQSRERLHRADMAIGGDKIDFRRKT
jgi:hypothetical protein